MRNIVKEYGASILGMISGFLLLGILRSIFWGEKGLLMELIKIWGRGGC